MKSRQRNLISVLLMLALSLAPALGPSPGIVATADCLTTTVSVTLDLQPSQARFSTAVTGDFDRDELPDQADFSSHHTIRVRLGNAQVHQLPFEADQLSPGRLVSDDIDDDDDQDLVWISENRSIAPIVWLGDGKGQFVKAEHPESFHQVARLAQADNHRSSLFDEPDQNDPASDEVSDDSIGLLAGEPARFDVRCVTPDHTFSNCAALAPCIAHLHQRGPPATRTR